MKLKKGTIKTKIPALEAASGLNVGGTNLGAILGQHQINIGTFCKEFNDATNKFEKGIPLPTKITKYHDRTYSFIIKTPNFYDMFFQAAAKKHISLVDLHDVMRYFCYLRKIPFNEETLPILFGSISSLNYKFSIKRN